MEVKRTSIKDIAERLGVSTATVSLVLNNRAGNGRVSKEMIEKIKHTAKEMNYHPNTLARSLQSGRSQTIGLIVADISNSFFGELALHVQKEAEKFGYAVVIANTNENVVKMEAMIDVLKSRQVDGYIIVPAENGEKSVLSLVEKNIPVVLVDRYFPAIQVSNVGVENYDAAYKSTRFLVNKGCRNVALFVYKSNLSNMVERKDGYIAALKEDDLFSPDFICEVNYETLAEDIDIYVKKLLAENTVDGIFFSTNSISVIGIKVLLKYGVKIQEQIRVVCFDKDDAYDFMKKSIAYVKQPIATMGCKAVDILLDQITLKGITEGSETCKLSADLITDFIH